MERWRLFVQPERLFQGGAGAIDRREIAHDLARDGLPAAVQPGRERARQREARFNRDAATRGLVETGLNAGKVVELCVDGRHPLQEPDRRLMPEELETILTRIGAERRRPGGHHRAAGCQHCR